MNPAIISFLAYTVLPQVKLFGTHPSFIAVISSIIVFVLVSLATPPPHETTAKTFWGTIK
jgi:hypothetical protein